MSKLLKILEATTRNDLPQFSVLCRGIVNREREGPRRRGRARIVMFPSLKLCSSECAPRAPTGSSRLSDAHRGLPCAGLAPLDATRPAAPGPRWALSPFHGSCALFMSTCRFSSCTSAQSGRLVLCPARTLTVTLDAAAARRASDCDFDLV